MNISKTIFIFLLLLMLSVAAHASDSLLGPAASIQYSYASKRIEASFWGIAAGNFFGDRTEEIALLERRAVKVGTLGEKGFVEGLSCPLPGVAVGTRIYAFDIDGNDKDELIINAVEDSIPASIVLNIEDKKCRIILDRVRLSLRVLNGRDGRPMIAGQGWSSNSFFSGHIWTLKYEDGKLKREEPLDLPKPLGIYDFAFPRGEGNESEVAVIKGYNPLEIYDRLGKRFKRVWHTGERMGGSINLIDAPSREVMGEVDSEKAAFDMPPLCDSKGNIYAVHLNLPIKNAIGKKPFVSGSEIAAFRPDSAFMFTESMRTANLPAAAVDMIVRSDGPAETKILVLLQDNRSMFLDATGTIIVEFTFGQQ